LGVGQPAKLAAWFNVMFLVVASIEGQRSPSVLVAVGQPANSTACFKAKPPSRPGGILSPVPSIARGVGQPVGSVTDVRRTDARRRERNRPEGITQGFHVSVYKVEPRVCILARNLLSIDCCRAALADEVVEGWPQVPLVIKRRALACLAERLARTGTSPNRSIIWPACGAKGVGPNTNACEEVALGVGLEVIGVNIFDAPFVNITRCNVARSDEVAQPLGCIRLYLVVVGGHEVNEKSPP
jgi:hypothetical protein